MPAAGVGPAMMLPKREIDPPAENVNVALLPLVLLMFDSSTILPESPGPVVVDTVTDVPWFRAVLMSPTKTIESAANGPNITEPPTSSVTSSTISTSNGSSFHVPPVPCGADASITAPVVSR